MRLRCTLKEKRGTRSLRELAAECGVSASILSQIERGRTLPADSQLRAIEQAYGAEVQTWYPFSTLLALEHDDEAAA